MDSKKNVKQREVKPKTSAPLIELHGYTLKEFQNFVTLVKKGLKKALDKYDYENLAFSRVPSKVVDVNGYPRPFIRFVSSEFAISQMIKEHLITIKWKGEMEILKLHDYKDLR